ncbi:MAG: hypothetical protein NT120_03925 [Candidatus Aenigmarchaeota archaeon]|nr:hypothetical protein [Candidatus Aenigmarchaeota archaeon]
MDLFLTKDEKIEALEKRIQALERRTDRNIATLNESFLTFQDVIIGMQKENTEIKKDRDFLLERYKEVIRRIDEKTNISRGIFAPVKNEIKESANLIRDIVLEDLDPERKNIDDLFELVMKSRKMDIKSAARKLAISEEQTKIWADKLQNKGLIKINGNTMTKT